MSRLFDDQSLQRLARAPEHDAIAALARGDLPALQRHLDDMDSGSAGLDALSGHTLARKIGKLRADFGEERTRAELRRIGTMLMRSFARQLGGTLELAGGSGVRLCLRVPAPA